MKKLATILLAASPLLHAAAQEKPRQEVSLLAGLIYDTTYELEASFHYLIHPCIGIGGGLGYYKQCYRQVWGARLLSTGTDGTTALYPHRCGVS